MCKSLLVFSLYSHRTHALTRLRARSATAQRTTALQSVGVAGETAVFDASQLCAAVVDAVRDAATGLTIDVAHILLQARVCDTARAVGDGAVGVCALRHGGCESREGKDDGGGSELHFEIVVVVK